MEAYEITEFRELQARAENAEAEVARLRTLYPEDQPWGVTDVLRKLSEAAKILLLGKDYDGHGHELIQAAMEEADRIVARIDAAREDEAALARFCERLERPATCTECGKPESVVYVGDRGICIMCRLKKRKAVAEEIKFSGRCEHGNVPGLCKECRREP